MPEPPEDLLAAVHDQAEVRLRMDVQGYASYLTPEATDTLAASFPGDLPRVASYEIENHEPRGVDHVFDVRYSARDVSFVVRSRWRRLDGQWMVVHAQRLGAKGEKAGGLFSRLLRRLRPGP